MNNAMNTEPNIQHIYTKRKYPKWRRILRLEFHSSKDSTQARFHQIPPDPIRTQNPELKNTSLSSPS